MPVKIGNSYVSEAAAAYAKTQVEESEENSKAKSKSQTADLLSSLSKQFKDVKFSVGTQPFNGKGTNNISIAPNILRQMANDPEKRLEYEALIYDCNQVLKTSANRPGLSAQGYIIGSDGGLRMWSISKSDSGKQNRTLLNMTEEEFKQRLAGRLPKKKSSAIDKIREESKKSKESKEKEEVDNNSDKESEKVGGAVVFNESKRARQLAAAQTVDDVRQLMELLKTDLEDCEEGLKIGWCDEEEVKKVKKMIERAQKRMNELPEVSDNPRNVAIDILI